MTILDGCRTHHSVILKLEKTFKWRSSFLSPALPSPPVQTSCFLHFLYQPALRQVATCARCPPERVAIAWVSGILSAASRCLAASPSHCGLR